jgi:predicted small metal-binding protein
MAEQLKTVECDAPCNFMVRSHDEKEIIEIVKQHAKKMHDMTITDDDVKQKMKPA